jgi:hypothetical protein
MEPGAVQSAGLLESDLAWAPTHTLTNPFTEVVDHSAAASILAAGFGSGIIRLNLPAAHFREQYGFWSMACACAQELGSR